MKCPLRKFAGDTELSSAQDTAEGRAAIQRDLHNFEKRVHENLTKLNKSKGFSSLSDLRSRTIKHDFLDFLYILIQENPNRILAVLVLI